VSQSPTPAFAAPRFFTHFSPLMALAVVAATFLVAYSLLHATAEDELMLVLLALMALGAGHGLMRSRPRRLVAEEDAARATAEPTLQARVGAREQRRKSLAVST